MTGTYPPASGAPLAPRPAPRPVRPPLDRSARGGAVIAGAVSFTLLNIGFAMFWIPILVGFIGLIFTTIVRFATRIDPDPDADFADFAEVARFLDPGVWAVPLVLVSVVGLGIMVAAVFISKRVLSGRRIERPWAITWSGIGVAIVANSVVGGILSGGFNLVSSFFGRGDGNGDMAMGDGGDLGDVVPLLVVIVVISVLVSLLVAAAIGALAMWWMAHVFRPAVSRDSFAGSTGAAGSPGIARTPDAGGPASGS